VRELRNKRDLSIRELAKLIERSPSMISEIEAGNRFPSEDMMGVLSRALRCTVDDLRQHDWRPRKREVNELVANNPDLGWVFRTVVDKAREGVPPRDLKEWLDQMPKDFKAKEESLEPNRRSLRSREGASSE